MASQEVHQLHFIFIPFLAQGHMIPMMDMACLFAKRGVISTIITTSLNAARFKPVIDKAAESGLSIRLIQFEFPWQEAGLPKGLENVDAIDSPESGGKFIHALKLLQDPIGQFIKEDHQPLPSCIISDSIFPWTFEIVSKLNIPRIVFHGMCSFSLFSTLNVRQYRPHVGAASEFELFVLPGMPHKIEISKAQLPQDLVDDNSTMREMFDKCREVDSMSYGVVINSFNELEPEYVDNYKKAMGKSEVWTIGPVSLCNKEISEKEQRGNRAAIDKKKCLNWLDTKKTNSVIYACFGTLGRLTPTQLKEIGLGLEASNQPFVWVIRNNERIVEVEKWLSEGFEDRVKERGLIIRGWAPQTLILSHPAIGGFLTHCGWNSILEGICAGVPFIAWPLSFEQFLNEKLIVRVLRIGVSIGIRAAVTWFDEEKDELVGMERVKNVVEWLMGNDQEAKEMRMRARKLVGESARKAMEEGGSSYNNMTLLIEDIMEQARKKKWCKEI